MGTKLFHNMIFHNFESNYKWVISTGCHFLINYRKTALCNMLFIGNGINTQKKM